MITNFLVKTAFSANSAVLFVLDEFRSWREIGASLFPGKCRNSVQREVKKLAELGALIRENDALEALEARSLAQWEWAVPSALFHFTLQDTPYLSSQAAVEAQKNRACHDPSPPLYLTHDNAHRLPKVSENALNRLFIARRTHREAAHRAISLGQLADWLFICDLR